MGKTTTNATTSREASSAGLEHTAITSGLITSTKLPKRKFMRIVTFLALFAGLAILTDQGITIGLRRIPTSEFGVLNRIMNGNVNADIIISGSSRALVHYDPRIIHSVTGHSAFNIGRNGSQTDMQSAFLRAYLATNSKPRLIIHNLDLFSFAASREIYDSVQYVPYLHDSALFAGVRRVYKDAWKWKYIPLYGYVVPDMRLTWIKGIKGLLGLYPKEDHFDGYVPRDTPWTEDFDRFKNNNPHGVSFEIEPDGQAAIAEIIDLCRNHQIPLLFVYSPEYIEMQALEKNRNDIFRHFRMICDQTNVPLWDFSESFISLDREHFYNSQHLNTSGASLFSHVLAQRLRAEWTSFASPTTPLSPETKHRFQTQTPSYVNGP